MLRRIGILGWALFPLSTLIGAVAACDAQTPPGSQGSLQQPITLQFLNRSQKSPLQESPFPPPGVKPCKPGAGNELAIIRFKAAKDLELGAPEMKDVDGGIYRQLCSQKVIFKDGHVEGTLVFDVPVGRRVNTLSLAGTEFDLSKLREQPPK